MMRTVREPHIQSLRALAALLVLIYHADLLPGGYIGVDIFYVISGYLITNLLLREIEERNNLAFAAFYARRFKRLLPASFLVVLTTGITGWAVLPSTYRADFGRDLIAASTYISNFLFALWNADYQNLGSTPSPFIHFWSLAVEEQFYLFWPIIILILFRLKGRKGVFYGVLAVASFSFIFSLYLTEGSPVWSFYILPTRAWELAIGALILFASERMRERIFSRPQWGLLALLLIVGSSIIYNENTSFPGTAAIIPVLATALLILSMNKWPPFLDKTSRHGVVQWLGKISYPLYLWHWPVLVIPEIYLSRELTPLELVVAIFIVLLLADFTHRFVEEPLRYRAVSSKKVYLSTLLATLVSVFLGLAIIFSYNSSITSASGFSFDIDEVRQKPKNNLDGCHIHVGVTVAPKCEYGDTTSNKTVVLYGDSHAAQWLPALDIVGRENGLKIVSLTKSACPAAEVIKELSSQYRVADCQAFRDSSIKRISQIKPSAVIMTGMQPFTAPNSEINSRNWWLSGEATALSRIKKYTDFPIYLTDTPLPQVDIPTCLAEMAREKCDTSRPISPEVAPGLIPLNPTPWLCEETCPAVIDGVVVYRDKSHLTVAMSQYLAPYLAKELIRLGVIK
ncbi:MAG: acyltransferase family protein [Actinobacteria bacterium]|nr:acyltransferase family protein [Actinomycetota bacterium]MTA20768.1 acyltransferase family protein [Actinomycetota bacterium]